MNALTAMTIVTATRTKKLSIFLISLMLLGQACVIQQTSGSDGGVFKSSDFGESWEQKVFISQQKKRVRHISKTNVLEITVDPTSPQTVYIGTQENGMFVSLDAAEHWVPILSNTGTVRAIAVDPKNKKVIYASLGARIHKTVDAGKNWTLIFSEPRNEPIYEIQIDPQKTNRLYAGTNDGQVIKSTDAGMSWSLIGTFGSRVRKILINPKNPKVIFTATRFNGLFRSKNEGQTWEELKRALQAIYDHTQILDAVMEENAPEKLTLATTSGLTHTENNGDSFTEIKLLTLPGAATLYAVVINPKQPKNIVYATAQHLFRTRDAGKTWISKPLPTKRIPTKLVLDPKNPQTIYLGVIKPD